MSEDYFSNDEDQGVIPDFIGVSKDLPLFYQYNECYLSMYEEGMQTCSYGNTTDPKYSLALVGGSHSGHWFPGLVEAAEALDIELQLYYKDACRFSADDFNGGLNESCMEWNKNILSILQKEKPDMVFTTATVRGSLEIPQGYIEMWE